MFIQNKIVKNHPFDVKTNRNSLVLFSIFVVMVLGFGALAISDSHAISDRVEESTYMEESTDIVYSFVFGYFDVSNDFHEDQSMVSIVEAALPEGTTSVTIPSSINGLSVVGINGAFHDSFFGYFDCVFTSNSESVTSVIIPDGVTGIGFGCFSEMSALSTVTIPDSVVSIRAGSFGYCPELKTAYCSPEVFGLYETWPDGCVRADIPIVDPEDPTDPDEPNENKWSWMEDWWWIAVIVAAISLIFIARFMI